MSCYVFNKKNVLGHTLLLDFSCRRKLNNRFGETLSQRVVQKNSDVPVDSFALLAISFAIITLTSVEPGTGASRIHGLLVVELRLAQNLLLIRSANFKKLVLPICGIRTDCIKRNKYNIMEQLKCVIKINTTT